jgi:membrane protease YdiL (CAAX protease family)
MILLKPGMKALYGLWFAAVIVLLIGDRNMAYIAIGAGLIFALIIVLGKWTLPPGDDEPKDELRQQGSRASLTARGVVLVVAIAWFFLLGTSLAINVPHLTDFMHRVIALNIGLPRGGLAPFITLTLAVIPALLLLALGATRQQLGLLWTFGGPTRLVLWVVIPLAIGLWRVVTRRVTSWELILMVVENVMLNGFPEEFLFRGAVLSYLRGLLSTDWAFFFQALLFAFVHIGLTIPEEHANALLILANVLGLNIPFAVLFGLMALRSRSIAMGATIHFSLDAMRHLL